MKKKDTYKTIKKTSDGLYKDKGSKFISFAYPVSDEETIKEILTELRKNYYDAHHHCYAWVLGYQKELFKFNDDGEPSGTAGKPIYGQILSHDLCNILIVVIRYFGGTKLGVRGLINAYKGAAKDVLDNSIIIENIIQNFYRVHFEYIHMNDVMRVMKEHELTQHAHDFTMDCRLEFSVRLSQSDMVTDQLEKIHGVRVEFLEKK